MIWEINVQFWSAVVPDNPKVCQLEPFLVNVNGSLDLRFRAAVGNDVNFFDLFVSYMRSAYYG